MKFFVSKPAESGAAEGVAGASVGVGIHGCPVLGGRSTRVRFGLGSVWWRRHTAGAFSVMNNFVSLYCFIA